mmetsp:Transcript_102572/g.289763  ORF Transcript_102572/g.289763 Transcript_102572/m.289763 type:complete len:219 (-) Transcript_102572:329-985(-)
MQLLRDESDQRGRHYLNELLDDVVAMRRRDRAPHATVELGHELRCVLALGHFQRQLHDTTAFGPERQPPRGATELLQGRNALVTAALQPPHEQRASAARVGGDHRRGRRGTDPHPQLRVCCGLLPAEAARSARAGTNCGRSLGKLLCATGLQLLLGPGKSCRLGRGQSHTSAMRHRHCGKRGVEASEGWLPYASDIRGDWHSDGPRQWLHRCSHRYED